MRPKHLKEENNDNKTNKVVQKRRIAGAYKPFTPDSQQGEFNSNSTSKSNRSKSTFGGYFNRFSLGNGSFTPGGRVKSHVSGFTVTVDETDDEIRQLRISGLKKNTKKKKENFKFLKTIARTGKKKKVRKQTSPPIGKDFISHIGVSEFQGELNSEKIDEQLDEEEEDKVEYEKDNINRRRGIKLYLVLFLLLVALGIGFGAGYATAKQTIENEVQFIELQPQEEEITTNIPTISPTVFNPTISTSISPSETPTNSPTTL